MVPITQSGRGGRLGCFEDVEVKVRLDEAEEIEDDYKHDVSPSTISCSCVGDLRQQMQFHLMESGSHFPRHYFRFLKCSL